MTAKELNAAIAAQFSVKENADLRRTINAAIRTLPGGNQTLDALTTTNAARNHAQKARASDRIVAIDAALDSLETIRDAMELHVRKSIET